MSWTPSPSPPPPSARKAGVARPGTATAAATQQDDQDTPPANPARPTGPTRELSDVHIDLFSTGVGKPRGVPQETLEDEQDARGRVSMYVRIVDEMLSTVLKSDAYLFTPQELHVLQHFNDLEYGPKYLLTRLLLRKTNKIFSVKEIVAKYSTELGESHIPGYMDGLIETMDIPEQLKKLEEEASLPTSRTVQSSQTMDTGEMLKPNELLVDSLDEFPLPKVGGHEAPLQQDAQDEPLSLNQPANSPLNRSVSPRPVIKASTTPTRAPEIIELSSDSDSTPPTNSKRPLKTPIPKPSESRLRRADSTPAKTPSKVHPLFAFSATPLRAGKPHVAPVPTETTRPTLPSTPPKRTLSLPYPNDNDIIEIMSSPPAPVASSSKLREEPRLAKREERGSSSEKAKGKRPVMVSSAPSVNGQSAVGPDGKPITPTQDDLESFYTYKKLSNLTSKIRAFARGIDEMTVEEMISQLTMSELVKIAKELKLWKSKYNRGEMIGVLLASANKQSRLSFAVLAEKKREAGGKGASSPASGSQQTTLGFAASGSTMKNNGKLTGRTILWDKIAEAYGGRAVQIALPFRSLVHRLNLVYYRSTITPSTGIAKSLMLPEILTSSSKRTYPDVMATRSQVWPNRDALIDYESALEMEAMVDEALGEQNHSTGNWIGQNGYGFGIKGGRIEGARRVKRAWQNVHENWLAAVRNAEQEVGRSQSGSRHVLDRFELGHILTRVVSKGSTALGILHEYDQECQVLRTLLAQRVWRRGKRGAWYDRLALVLMNHYAGDFDKKREAVEVCLDGLEDNDTHLIYRPRLSRRLKRLEKQLELSKEERHICEAALGQPEKRFLKAHRIRTQVRDASTLRSFFAAKRDAAANGSGDEQDYSNEGAPSREDSRSSKTTWLGREGGTGVEAWVLEWWAQEGWEGFHAEASILTSLFTLLFWPILYLPLSGAFETPYQLAPLDLGSDSFYASRAEAIETRLAAMQKTSDCLQMLAEADDQERPKGTLAVGLSWDFSRTDLQEIVQCLGGKALSILCRMFCEEYGHRASGVPDLIVWNMSEKRARFVEVKSPNDHLSETQKIWISVLQTAGVEVEVCHVVEAGSSEKGSLKGINKRSIDEDAVGQSTKRRKSTKTYNFEDPDEINVDEEDEDGMELEEWRYESGDEAAERTKRNEGKLMTRAQAQALDDDDGKDEWSGSEYDPNEHLNKENRAGTGFRIGAPVDQLRGGSQKKMRAGQTRIDGRPMPRTSVRC